MLLLQTPWFCCLCITNFPIVFIWFCFDSSTELEKILFFFFFWGEQQSLGFIFKKERISICYRHKRWLMINRKDTNGLFSCHLTFDVILVSALTVVLCFKEAKRSSKKPSLGQLESQTQIKGPVFLCTAMYFYLFRRNILAWILAIWNKVEQNLIWDYWTTNVIEIVK